MKRPPMDRSERLRTKVQIDHKFFRPFKNSAIFFIPIVIQSPICMYINFDDHRIEIMIFHEVIHFLRKIIPSLGFT